MTRNLKFDFEKNWRDSTKKENPPTGKKHDQLEKRAKKKKK